MNGLYDRLHVNVSCHLRDYVFFDSMLEMHKRLLSSTSIPMGTPWHSVEWYVEGMVVETSFLVKILIEVIEIYLSI